MQSAVSYKNTEDVFLTSLFIFQSEGTATIRTRKFMTNRLLCRKQMVCIFGFILFVYRFD
jgi:hypothetical protein